VTWCRSGPYGRVTDRGASTRCSSPAGDRVMLLRQACRGLGTAFVTLLLSGGHLEAGGQGPGSFSGGGSSFGGGQGSFQSSSFTGGGRQSDPFFYSYPGTNFGGPGGNGRTMTGGYFGFGFAPPPRGSVDSHWPGFSYGLGFHSDDSWVRPPVKRSATKKRANYERRDRDRPRQSGRHSQRTDGISRGRSRRPLRRRHRH
jgi:hypothetical protein